MKEQFLNFCFGTITATKIIHRFNMRNQTLDDELKDIILSNHIYRYSWDIFHPLDFRYVSVSGGVVITNQRIIARTEEYLWLDYQGWMSISTDQSATTTSF